MQDLGQGQCAPSFTRQASPSALLFLLSSIPFPSPHPPYMQITALVVNAFSSAAVDAVSLGESMFWNDLVRH